MAGNTKGYFVAGVNQALLFPNATRVPWLPSFLAQTISFTEGLALEIIPMHAEFCSREVPNVISGSRYPLSIYPTLYFPAAARERGQLYGFASREDTEMTKTARRSMHTQDHGLDRSPAPGKQPPNFRRAGLDLKICQSWVWRKVQKAQTEGVKWEDVELAQTATASSFSICWPLVPIDSTCAPLCTCGI